MTWYIDAYNEAKSTAKKMKKEIQEEIDALNEKIKVIHEASSIMMDCGTEDDHSYCQIRMTLNKLFGRIENLENEIKAIEASLRDAYKNKVNCEESAGEQLAIESYWRAMDEGGELYSLATGRIQRRAWIKMLEKLEKQYGPLQGKAQKQKQGIIESLLWK